MPSPHLRIAAVALATLTLTAPGSAQAAVRYASPSGSGSACTALDRCSVTQAVNGSPSAPIHTGDEVVIGPGVYPATATVLDGGGLTVHIHGELGQSRPVLVSTAQDGVNLNSSATLHRVEIRHSGPGVALWTRSAAAAHHVIARASGKGATACSTISTLADAVCDASGTNGVAFSFGVDAGFAVNYTADLRRVTAVATGYNGVAIDAVAGGKATVTVNATSVIAHGSAFDIRAVSSGPTAKTVVALAHSNFADVGTSSANVTVSPVGSATNQTATPVFVDAAGGNFREAASSLGTIDRGAAVAAGLLDLDGSARSIGGGADIGAYELALAPTLTNEKPPAVEETAAIVAATVNPHGTPTSVTFSYTPDGGAKTTTPASAAGSGMSNTSVQRGISGLVPGTHYTVTATASNGGGSVTSSTREFTTTGVPPSAETGQPAAPGAGDDTGTGTGSGADTPPTGPAGSDPATPQADPPAALVLRGLGMTQPRFRVRRQRGGTSVRFSLSRTANLRMTIRRSTGCTTRKARTAKRCRPRTVTLRGHAGANRVRFTGKGLKAGRYVATAIAIDGQGARSAPASLRFTILR
ncbi:MAG: hypothetical protein JHC95_15245 [Solirubrobacteraceae bacterium]|nr:hypothetical protein [Solirubrobacteraceae bacterium]